MLTPLVDVMFLLLIFFMLSSQTSLYTLLQVSAQAAAEGVAAPSASAELIAVVGHGDVRLNGERLVFADLPTALLRYQSAGIGRAMLMSGSAAQVQDVVTVLELFEAGDFSEVRLVAAAP